MSGNYFTPKFENLSEVLAIFPLARATVLPGQTLPLNIFEPRYLSMVFDALGGDRNIGMIQPQAAGPGAEEIYQVGCAARITAFQESDDGRVLINITGVCRFNVLEELPLKNGYRRVRPDWSAFAADLGESPPPPLGFAELETDLRRYFAANQLEASWPAMRKLSPADLIDFLSMHLPLAVEEKQALLEASSVVERTAVLCTALALGSGSAGQGATRH